MRIFNKIIKILFIVIFALSICLNVILAYSSSYSLVFKDDPTKRYELAQKATTYLGDGKGLFFENYDEQNKTKAIVTCYLKDDDSTSNSLKCEEITYVYDEDKKLSKTVYYPGDGYKYTNDGTSKTKESVSSSTIENYYNGLYYGAAYTLFYMMFDFDYPDNKDLFEASSKIHFDINTFSLTKSVSFKLKTSPSTSLEANLTFDTNDRIVKLESSNQTLKIGYNKQKINFPAFNGYIEG